MSSLLRPGAFKCPKITQVYLGGLGVAWMNTETTKQNYQHFFFGLVFFHCSKCLLIPTSYLTVNTWYQRLVPVRQEVKELIESKNCNPILVRLAWHDSGTYDQRIKEWPARGGANGAILFDPEMNMGANAGWRGCGGGSSSSFLSSCSCCFTFPTHSNTSRCVVHQTETTLDLQSHVQLTWSEKRRKKLNCDNEKMPVPSN